MTNYLVNVLGKQLIEAKRELTAPSEVADKVYETLYMADIDGLLADKIADCMRELVTCMYELDDK